MISKCEFIQKSIEFDNVFKITLNRPQKKNALNKDMYLDLIEALQEADRNPAVSFLVLTGTGDYFCSGNDLSNFMSEFDGQKSMDEMTRSARNLLEDFVNAFIVFTKPMIALVNGHCVGIGFTLLGLFDVVISTDNATFYAPFSKLGQSPEACSSYIFPLLMGQAKATEILIFDRKITSREAYDWGLVSRLLSQQNFNKETWTLVENYSKLPKETCKAIRRFMKEINETDLRIINKKECDFIMEQWKSDEFMQAIMNFFKNKSKL
jgi:Delta3-Delta2-enoyl-CoA isomerase